MSTLREATLAFLAAHRADRLVVVTDRLVETIEAQNPGYRVTNVVPRADLWRSCHDNVDRVLELLHASVEQGAVPRPGDDPDARGDGPDDHPFDAARHTGERRAQQGLPLDDVLRSFRIGGRLIWEDLVAQGDELDAGELRDLGTWLWEVVDETSAQVASAYHRHERAALRADAQQRAELWEAVLSGRAEEPGFAHEAARLLDLPATDPLLVVAAPAVTLARADHLLSPHATAWVRRTAGVVGLVALREDDPREAQQALARLARADQVPMGVSGVVPGLGRAAQGFRQATLALRAQGSTHGTALFDERLPEALLLSSPLVASRLGRRWLDPVRRLPASEADVLLGTLVAWVGTGGSATRTAARVHCHRNTVVNRLRRVTELTGHPLVDGAPPLELDLALRAWRMRLLD